LKSSSIRFDRNTRHAVSKAERVAPKLAAVPFLRFPRLESRIHTAIATEGGVVIADALHDSACVNIAQVDQLGLLKRAMVAAAGDGGHAPMKTRTPRFGQSTRSGNGRRSAALCD
jgi:hypothetical protein